MSPAKTNAIRLLERLGVDHELLRYDLADDEFSAEGVADQLGLPRDQVFKTLLAAGPDPMFGVIPAGTTLDLKALARASGGRQAAMVPLDEVFAITGYRRGAVTVLGAKRSIPVYLDEMALVHDRIAVSAGSRGLQVLVGTEDYRRVCRASIADITR